MDAIAAAGEELCRRTIDFNSGDQEGVGYYQLFHQNGWRCSHWRLLICARAKRKNLRTEVNAQVTRVLFEAPPWVWNMCSTARPLPCAPTARCCRWCGGAAKPAVADALRHRTRGASARAGDRHSTGTAGCRPKHAGPSATAPDVQVKKPITTNDDLQSNWRKFEMGWKWITRRAGRLAIGINHGGLFTRVLPESQTPDIQFHFATLSAEMAGAPTHPWSGCTFSVCQLRPESRGEIRLKSPIRCCRRRCTQTICRTTLTSAAPSRRSLRAQACPARRRCNR